MALVEAARGGERAAFARLHQLYAGMVHAVLLARVPRGDADDLTQDVFVAAMSRLASLRDAASFGAWLATIARNLATDHLRARRPMDELPDADRHAPAGGGGPAELVEASALLAVIRKLPEAYSETLLMRLCEGMTGPEIAERTGLEPGSVRVNLHRGMKLLEAALGGGGEDDKP